MGVLSNVCCLAGVAKLLRPVRRNSNYNVDVKRTSSASLSKDTDRADHSSEFLTSDTGDSCAHKNCANAFVAFALVLLVLVCNWAESPLAIVAIVSHTFVCCAIFWLCLASSFDVSGSLRRLSGSASTLAFWLWDRTRSLHQLSEGRGIPPCTADGIPLAFNSENAPCCIELAKQVCAEFPDGSGHWITVRDAQRQLRATDGNAEIAMQQLRTSIVWRKDVFAEWLDAEDPNISEFRVIALGHENRPMLYFCSVHQASGDVTARQMACALDRAIQKYCTGDQQQVDIVFDCHGFRPWLDPNVGAWIKLAGAFPSYFAERIHRIVVLDFSVVAGTFWRACKPFAPPKTLAKICFARRSHVREMQAIWDLCGCSNMREMVDSLLNLNLRTAVEKDRESTIAGREHSHRLSNSFLQTQASTQQTAVTKTQCN